jgi:hypothetical protein
MKPTTSSIGLVHWWVLGHSSHHLQHRNNVNYDVKFQGDFYQKNCSSCLQLTKVQNENL